MIVKIFQIFHGKMGLDCGNGAITECGYNDYRTRILFGLTVLKNFVKYILFTLINADVLRTILPFENLGVAQTLYHA